MGIWYVSFVSVLHLPDLLLRWTTWQPPAARIKSVTVSCCRSGRNVKSTCRTLLEFWESHQTVQTQGPNNCPFPFVLFQAQPPPTGRYCIALLIVVGVTFILVITGIFSYRHLSGLRVSTPIVLENNSAVGNQSEGVKLTQLCFVVPGSRLLKTASSTAGSFMRIPTIL